MPTYTTSTTSYSFKSGVLGNLVLTTNQSDVSDAYQNMTVVSASGTINGHTVTGVSNFDNPNNLSFYEYPVGYGADGSVHYYPYVDGFSSGYIFSRDYENFDPGKPNGVSVSTQDGINYHFYVAPATTGDTSHPYELDYRDNLGNSGKVTDDVVFRTVCFAKGARILLKTGERAVEDLKLGDRVITVGGDAREIVWIGHMNVRPNRLLKPHDALPVRIVAEALAPGIPVRDLIVSPGHALHMEGLLVRACDLINGATIRQEPCDQVDYYHVELASHDVLFANGAPCETYLDDGNRSSLNGCGTVSPFRGRLDRESSVSAYASYLDEGPVLTCIRSALLSRAKSLGWRECRNAQLQLVVDDVQLQPIAVVNNRFWFALPKANRGIFQLCSRAVRVDRVMAGCSDGRSLSVAIGSLSIDGDRVALDSVVWGTGFFPVESNGSGCWRWMGELATVDFQREVAIVEVTLTHVAPSLVLDDSATHCSLIKQDAAGPIFLAA